ncbi:hypothetical protein GCM10020001_060330 [Nonomuraea salmonea]
MCLISVLKERGIFFSSEAHRRIYSCPDLDILGVWFDRALKVSSVDALFEEEEGTA